MESRYLKCVWSLGLVSFGSVYRELIGMKFWNRFFFEVVIVGGL